MSPKQYKKVKLYRALKVLFYCCGLPLFVLAVFFTAVRYIGHDPFNGAATFTGSLDMMQSYERTLSGSSLYGVWCAFGIWLIIAFFQIIFAKTIKNRRARMFATVAITLVLMLGALLVIDTVYARKVDGFTNPINGEHTNGLKDNAPEGVVVEDYRTQLSYYRTISTEAAKKDLAKNLIDKIDLLKRVYNVEMEGYDKIGSAGNVSNDPITYATIISDDGQMGVDISFKDGKLQLEEVGKRQIEHKALLGGSVGTVVDNNILKGDDNQSLPSKNWHWGVSSEKAYNPNNTELPDYWDPTNVRYLDRQSQITGEVCLEANQVVRLAPNENNQLVINGITFTKYVPVARTDLAGNEYYVWYAKDLYPVDYDFENKKGVVTDGVYGEAIYNNNGNVADGWVFSFYNVLEILEDYYGSTVNINRTIQENKLASYEVLRAQIIADAAERRQEYYTTGAASAWEKALYKQETYNKNKFSFTHYRLDALLAEVGNMLGRNSLFDYLFSPDAVIGSLIQPILSPLREGVKLTEFLKGQFGLGDDVCDTVVGIFKKITGDDALTDVYIKLFYPAADEDGHFTLTIKKNDASGDVVLDIDFSNELVAYQEENPEFAFDLDHLSAFLNNVLNKFVDLSSMKDTLNTVLGLAGGLIKQLDTSNGVALNIVLLGSNVHIQLLDKDFKFALDIDEILLTLLDGLYYYESSCIQPVWNFYVDPDETKESMIYIEQQFADYDRAYFTGTKYGSLIGSTLIGKSLGANMAMSGGISYDEKYGLTDYVSVLQLKYDLSYMPECFPIYGFRDMVALFSGTVVLFVFLSYYAADKEYLWATGQLVVGEKKRKKKGEPDDSEGGKAEGADLTAQYTNGEVGSNEATSSATPPTILVTGEASKESNIQDKEPDPNSSYFDGKGGAYIGRKILYALLTAITVGIAYPFTLCAMEKWRLAHTVVRGRRMSFDGNGGQLIGKWILWIFLTIITFGIYSMFLPIKLKKWKAKHTHFVGEETVDGKFDGKRAQLVGYKLVGKLITLFTLGICYPTAVALVMRWETKHTIVAGRRLKFKGVSGGLMGRWIVWLLLSVVTFGVYALFVPIRIEKWKVSHIEFADKNDVVEDMTVDDDKKTKKGKKSKKGKKEPAQEGTDVPVQENSDKEVR